ncbi:MAG: transposase [Betaproteobacteria bacterium]|nr:transposase [Betaproteobacteria bacterium]
MRPKPYIEGTNVGQATFAPECVDDLIAPENPVRFIRVFVEALDLQAMGFIRSKPRRTGRPGYDPAILLMLYIYGHLNRIRSSRMLERECARNVELWWLLSQLVPDHNTIADFRKDNRKPLKKMLGTFVRLCREMGLVKGEKQCVDGSPFKAVNGLKQSTSVELSQKKLAYAKEQLELVEAYLRDMDEADAIDQGRLDRAFALDIDPKNLPDPKDIRARIEKHEQAIKEMRESGETQLLYTDPDARVMPTKDGGRRACYNMQVATDVESHMITGFDTTNDRNDMNKLCTTAKIAMENLGIETAEFTADKGYSSAKDVEACILNGIAPQVGMVYDRDERVINLSHIPAEITEKERQSTKAEDIRRCLHTGVLPCCYENTDICVELQYESELSCFIRHEDGTVTCPMGKPMLFQGKKKNGTVYGSKEACRTCPNRCTDGRTFKTVKFGPHTSYVPVKMYGSPRYPLQQIPDVNQPDHYHAFGRVKRAQARVMVYIKRNKAKLKERMRVSEHPFGTIKWYDGAYYFLCKGKEKIAAEASLMYLSYDIRRAITLAGGVQNLIHRMRETLARMKSQGIALQI